MSRRKGKAKSKAIEMLAAGKRCQSESSPCLIDLNREKPSSSIIYILSIPNLYVNRLKYPSQKQ